MLDPKKLSIIQQKKIDNHAYVINSLRLKQFQS